MNSPIQQKTSAATSGPPPESIVRASSSSDLIQALELTWQDYALVTVTDTAIEPMSTIAEHDIDPSVAVVAALQDLAQGINPSKEIDLTAEPDSIFYIDQNNKITQLQALGTIFWRMRRNGYQPLGRDACDILPPMIDGIVEYMKQRETIQKEMQQRINLLQGENVMLRGLQDAHYRLQTDYARVGNHIEQLTKENQGLDQKWKSLERTLIQLENSYQMLRIRNERLEDELNAVPDEDAESDIGDQSKKRNRNRRDVSVGATSRDGNESDTESRSDKRVRRET